MFQVVSGHKHDCIQHRKDLQLLSQNRRLLSSSAFFWDITRRRVVIFFYRRFADSWPVKMGPICCAETSVNNYHTTPRNIPEERRCHLHRGGSLKSRLLSSCWYSCFLFCRSCVQVPSGTPQVCRSVHHCLQLRNSTSYTRQWVSFQIISN
jgi:hypothetical protein